MTLGSNEGFVLPFGSNIDDGAKLGSNDGFILKLCAGSNDGIGLGWNEVEKVFVGSAVGTSLVVAAGMKLLDGRAVGKLLGFNDGFTLPDGSDTCVGAKLGSNDGCILCAGSDDGM